MAFSVLIVDDSDVMRGIVRRVLVMSGLHLADVFEAGDGLEALALLEMHRVDIVLADLHMPVMDGVELIKALRSEPAFKFTPIVMLTTESGVDKKTAGREAGATGWMVKPFKPEELLSVVKRLIG